MASFIPERKRPLTVSGADTAERKKGGAWSKREQEIIRSIEETADPTEAAVDVAQRIQTALHFEGFSRDLKAIQKFISKKFLAPTSVKKMQQHTDLIKCGAARVLGLHRLTPEEAGTYLTELSKTLLMARQKGESEVGALILAYPETRVLFEMRWVAEGATLEDFFEILLEQAEDGGDMIALAYDLQER